METQWRPSWNSERGPMRPLLWVFALFCVVSLASFLGWAWWGFGLTSHFRPQLALTAAVFLIFLLVGRRWIPGGIAAVLVIAHGLPLVPYLIPGVQAGPCADAHPVRLMTLNLHHRHADIRAVAALVRAERPDVVLLTEFLPRHVTALAALHNMLPHSLAPTGRGTFEMLLLSRVQVAEHRVHRGDPSAPFLPVLEARLCPAGGDDHACMTLIGLHTSRPMGPGAAWQRRQLGLAGRLAARVPNGRVVVAGDLNATPWSSGFADLLAAGRLRDAAAGAPLRATWIARNPLLGLPIDHVLVGPEIAVRDRRVGQDVGSDHFPVVADLAVCGDGVAPVSKTSAGRARARRYATGSDAG